MADKKLSETIRAASAVNLRYSADLLNLGRDYVKAFSAALSKPEEDDDVPGGPDGGPGIGRPPLLLAGRTGEVAHAAFAVNGTAGMKEKISFRVDGDFSDTKVSVDPKGLPAGSEGQHIVRIIAKIGRKTPEDTDFAGSVVIPELDHRVTDFVLRKIAAPSP